MYKRQVLPEGTKIYSNRITIDGKTMQERKKAREKKITKLSDILASNPTDVIHKTTLNRQKLFADIEEEGDLAIQEMANQIRDKKNNKKSKEKLAFGTGEDGIDDGGLGLVGLDIPLWNPESTTPEIPRSWYLGMTPPFEELGAPKRAGVTVNTALPVGSPIPVNATLARPAGKPVSTDMPYTSGDQLGFLGNLLSGIAPLATTIANRAGDKPNVNAYRNFGKNAIAANQRAMDAVNSTKDSTLSDIDLQATGQRARNRTSARGVNTLRALDLSTSAQTNTAKTRASNSYAQQIASLFGQQSGLFNQQDAAMAEGTLIADRANSNLGKNLGHISTLFQKTGKQMNEHQQNNEILSILPELSKYGLGYIYDETGKPVLTKVK